VNLFHFVTRPAHQSLDFWVTSTVIQFSYTIRTIRYDTVDLRALKSWRDGQLNLAHGPETKNNEKNQNQKPSSSEETVQAKVSCASPGRRSETKGVGLPGVKERWSYRCTKWWIRRRRSDGWRNRWAGDGGTGARMRFTKRQRELLIPETRWSSAVVQRRCQNQQSNVTHTFHAHLNNKKQSSILEKRGQTDRPTALPCPHWPLISTHDMTLTFNRSRAMVVIYIKKENK